MGVMYCPMNVFSLIICSERFFGSWQFGLACAKRGFQLINLRRAQGTIKFGKKRSRPSASFIDLPVEIQELILEYLEVIMKEENGWESDDDWDSSSEASGWVEGPNFPHEWQNEAECQLFSEIFPTSNHTLCTVRYGSSWSRKSKTKGCPCFFPEDYCGEPFNLCWEPVPDKPCPEEKPCDPRVAWAELRRYLKSPAFERAKEVRLTARLCACSSYLTAHSHILAIPWLYALQRHFARRS
jgi:hypothetical protein